MGKRAGGDGGGDRPRKKHMANSFGRANVRKRFAAKHARVFDHGSVSGILASTDPNKEPQCLSELTSLLKDAVAQLVESGRLVPSPEPAPAPASKKPRAHPAAAEGEAGSQSRPDGPGAEREAGSQSRPDGPGAEPNSKAPAEAVAASHTEEGGGSESEEEEADPQDGEEAGAADKPGPAAAAGAPRHWRVIDTGTSGLVFVAARAAWLDVRVIVDHLLAAAGAGALARPPRFTYRLLPVIATCVAEMGAVERLCAAELPPVFGAGALAGPVTYAVQFKGRNNERVKRDDAIKAAAAAIEGRHAVDLRDPSITVFLDVFKSAFALSVVERVGEKCKCNLAEIAKRRAAGPGPGKPADVDAGAAPAPGGGGT
eukprot:tig00001187_g7460.t1